MQTDTVTADMCSCERDFADWYMAHGTKIRDYILSQTHDLPLAEDCTSQTFLRAFTQRHSFQCRGRGVSPWLFTIARNIVHDVHKSAWYRRETTTEFLADEPDVSASPEQQVQLQEMLRQLRTCLVALPADQARCITLRFLDELSVPETARAMQRPEGAVRALQHRAIRRLRTMF
jgi:RNA polymerase sigma-70 factor (ECF subfamily)